MIKPPDSLERWIIGVIVFCALAWAGYYLSILLRHNAP